MKLRGAVLCLLGAAVAMLLAPGPSAAAGSGTVRVLRSIPFSREAAVRQKVKDDCKLQTEVPYFLSRYSSQVQLVDGSLGSSGRTLRLEITQVHAPPGGGFSGRKWMSVRGVLRDNGRRVAGFSAVRATTGGFFANYKGTCATVERCARALGSDIARWLENPKDDVHLGR